MRSTVVRERRAIHYRSPTEGEKVEEVAVNSGDASGAGAGRFCPGCSASCVRGRRYGERERWDRDRELVRDLWQQQQRLLGDVAVWQHGQLHQPAGYPAVRL